jgi:hypothetical protein
MSGRGFSTSCTLRRLHDPSVATFVRVAALPGFALRCPLDPAALPPAGPHHPRDLHCSLGRPPGGPSGRRHRAPWTAIQIP